ncbi:hypothetical protein DERP_006882 [Dermatophagoides pteronyssinus]|uniref:Uncharacterized protein n=1 Tax=Dermatophagoides pteronyssinus TaxID=6956 RepID=A0ABQ8ISA1_DERPT|nr:hypothetical protein DERP_006882 [Dermatophagoides pteronyssinus]
MKNCHQKQTYPDFLNDFNSIDTNDNQNDHYQQQQQQSSGINIDQFQYLNDDLNNSLQNSDENESNKKFVKSIQHPTRFLEPKLISPSKIPDVYLPQQDSSSPKQQQHQELDNYVDYDVPKNEFTTGDKYQSYHSPEKSLMVPVGERVHFVRVNDQNQPQSSSIVSKLDYNKNEPYEPSVIELPSSQPVLPIVFNFKTKASPVIAKTTHKPSPQSSSVQYFETHEPPHYREHTVHKPVIQDFHEIIVPYRVYIQEIQPVNEFHHTIVSTTPNESKTSSSLPMNPYSSSSLSLSQSSASTKNPNPFQNFIDQHQYSHQYQRPYSYHSHQQQKRPHYQSYNHFNQLPMNYNPFLAASPPTPTMEMTNHMTKVPVYAPIEFNPIHHSPHNQWGHSDHLVPIFGNSQQIPSFFQKFSYINYCSHNNLQDKWKFSIFKKFCFLFSFNCQQHCGITYAFGSLMNSISANVVTTVIPFVSFGSYLPVSEPERFTITVRIPTLSAARALRGSSVMYNRLSGFGSRNAANKPLNLFGSNL